MQQLTQVIEIKKTSGRKKDRKGNTKYYTLNVNFGTRDQFSRAIVEQYRKDHGSNKVSDMTRKLWTMHFFDAPEFRDAKLKHFKNRKLEVVNEIQMLNREIDAINEEAQRFKDDVDL